MTSHDNTPLTYHIFLGGGQPNAGKAWYSTFTYETPSKSQAGRRGVQVWWRMDTCLPTSRQAGFEWEDLFELDN